MERSASKSGEEYLYLSVKEYQLLQKVTEIYGKIADSDQSNFERTPEGVMITLTEEAHRISPFIGILMLNNGYRVNDLT